MGFTSQAGQVILRSQTVAGTYNADTGTGGVGIKLKAGSLGSNRDLLVPDAEIGGGRDVVDGYLGAVSWSGDYEFYARIDAIATLLKAALGTAADPVTLSGVTTHTITPLDSGTLPFLSIEENLGGTLETYNYNDAVVNTFHLESDASGYLSGSAGIIAIKQVSGAVKTPVPTYDGTPMYVGTNIAVQYNGVTLPAKSFSLDINNNVEDGDFRLGSFYIGDLTAKRREVTASFNIRAASSAMWRQAVYGASAAVAPSGIATKSPLVITIISYEDIPLATPAGKKYEISITIPNFVLKPFSIAASGDDIIENDVEGQAVRPAPGTPLMTVVLKTGVTGIAIK